MRLFPSAYQEFHFPEARGKYLKVRSLANATGAAGATIGCEFQLFGRLE